MVYVIYIVKVHLEVILPAEEIMVTILDSKHFPFVIRHSQVPSMQIVHLRAQTHLLFLSDKRFSMLEWSKNESDRDFCYLVLPHCLLQRQSSF